MTEIVNSNWETGEITDGGKWQVTGSPVIVSPGLFGSAYAAQGGLGSSCHMALSGNPRILYARLRLRYTGSLGSGGDAAALYIFGNSTGRLLLGGITNDGGTYKWFLRSADPASQEWISDQQLPSPNTEYWVEIMVTCSSTPGVSADGEYHIWVNGVELADITQTGIITTNAYAAILYTIYPEYDSGMTITVDNVIARDVGPIGPETGAYYTLDIISDVGGTTDTSFPPGSYPNIAEGTQVGPITAIPDATHNFVRWELDGIDAGSANPVNVIMNANHTLRAVFTEETFTLTIDSTPIQQIPFTIEVT